MRTIAVPAPNINLQHSSISSQYEVSCNPNSKYLVESTQEALQWISHESEHHPTFGLQSLEGIESFLATTIVYGSIQPVILVDSREENSVDFQLNF